MYFYWKQANDTVFEIKKALSLLLDLRRCPVDEACRSRMNVPFRVSNANEELEKKFVDGASKRGMISLKGHRSDTLYRAHQT